MSDLNLYGASAIHDDDGEVTITTGLEISQRGVRSSVVAVSNAGEVDLRFWE